MKTFLFVLFTACTALLGCSSAKNLDPSVISQGITGQITAVNGNQMPMKGAERAAPKGIQTTVLIYEPTHISQVTRSGTSAFYTTIGTKPVASVVTDSTGTFTLSLPPGSYSVFIKQGKQFYANLFDSQNNIALFVVEAGKLTRVNLSVSSSATF